MPAEPPDPSDPLGLHRPGPAPSPLDRAGAVLADLGLTPRGAAVGFALCLVAVLAWWWLRSPAPPPAEAEVPLSPAATTPSAPPEATSPAGPVYAHAAGAVRRPGLYELVAGDRVADLLTAAGGALPAADLDRINLAAPVADGAQVVVPRRGEALPAPAGPAGPPSGAEAPVALVDVNTADLAALETLPGIGPATGAAIIEHREANGPFTSVDQLIDVAGIGEAKLAAIADLVAVGAP